MTHSHPLYRTREQQLLDVALAILILLTVIL